MESAKQDTSSTSTTTATVVQCKNCGDHEDTSRYEPGLARELTSLRFCHSCNFWWRHSTEPHEGAVVSTMWEHFVVGDEEQKYSARMRGFGGTKWEILPLDPDQTPFYTTNLWHQGTIPMECRKWFTRTAYVRQYTRR